MYLFVSQVEVKHAKNNNGKKRATKTKKTRTTIARETLKRKIKLRNKESLKKINTNETRHANLNLHIFCFSPPITLRRFLRKTKGEKTSEREKTQNTNT